MTTTTGHHNSEKAKDNQPIPKFIIQNKNPNETLIPTLEKLLPSSLPVLRRIQYDCAHPRKTAYYLVSANLILGNGEMIDEPWTAAYVDLFAGRETQIWVYSSLEAEVLSADDDNVDNGDESISDFSTVGPIRQDIAREQFWDLLHFINRDLMPAYLSHLSEISGKPSRREEQEGDIVEHKVKVMPKHKAPAMLLGSVHTGLIKFLLANINDSYTSANFRPGLKVHRYDLSPYVKYIFPSKIFQTSDGQSNPLPQGYYFGRNGLLPDHVELVISRTHIPRERETLLSMPSVVQLFPDTLAFFSSSTLGGQFQDRFPTYQIGIGTSSNSATMPTVQVDYQIWDSENQGDWGHVSLFLDVLNTTQSPARALQAWLTTLNQMKYYDSLSRFSVGSEATYMFSITVSVPSRWAGFATVVVVVVLHMLLTLCTAAWYLLATEHTMLGNNSWQVVAQLVSDTTLPLLREVTNAKDDEVKKLIRRRGPAGGKKTYGVVRSETTGRSELVAMS